MPWTADKPPKVATNWTQSERESCVGAANAVLQDGGTDEEAVFACIHAAGKEVESMPENKAERKSFVFKLENLDIEGRTLEGHVAIFGNIDRVDDIIHPGAFTKTIAERGQKVKFLWQHDPGEPLGRPLVMQEDGKGLFVKALISDTQRGRDALALLKDDAINQMSIGYDPISFDYTKKGEKTIRNLREVRLHEFSLVTFAANEEATVTALKEDEKQDTAPLTPPEEGRTCVCECGASVVTTEKCSEVVCPECGKAMEESVAGVEPTKAVGGKAGLPLASRERGWDATAAVGRVRSWSGSEDEPSARYRQGFFWYDADNADNFGAYKLPFADVIDGTLTAIPRGIFAVAGVLSGARGGVDIPAADIATIRGKVASYYAKMRTQFDDDSIVAPWKKEGEAPEETKEGRVLSSKNRMLIGRCVKELSEAVVALQELLAATEPVPKETEKGTGAPEEVRAAFEDKGIEQEQTDDDEAGPVKPLTSVEDLRRALRIGILDLELMEVSGNGL